MYGFNSAAAQQALQQAAKHSAVRGFAPGQGRNKTTAGPVRGPGTGTSDSIETEVPEGTFIMPADSTAQIGEEELEKMGGGKVPVNLSNGEFSIPPEQVHAVGVQALEQMKGATHTPVPEPRGFKPQMFFANGGPVSGLHVSERPWMPQDERTFNRMPSQGNPNVSTERIAELRAARAPGGAAAGPTTAPPSIEPASPGVGRPAGFAANASGRLGQGFKAFTGISPDAGARAPSTVSKAAGAVGRVGASALSKAGRLAAPLAVASEGFDVAKVALDPNASGLDVATQAAQGAGRLGAAGLGAAAGATLGSVVPVVGTAIGGIAGGLAGYLGADKMIESGRAALGSDPRAPADRAIPPSAAAPAIGSVAAGPATPGQIPSDPSFNALRATLNTGSSRGFTAGGALPAPNDANNVTRVGNSYSGQDITQGFTVNGRTSGAGGGRPSAQSQGAAQGLSDRYAAEAQANPSAPAAGFQPGGAIGINGGGVGGPASADKFRAQVAQSNAQTAIRDGLNSTNSRVRAAAMQAMTAMQGDATQLQGLGMREAGENQRTNVRDAGETGRTAMRDTGETARTVMRESGDNRRAGAANQIANGRLDLDRTAQGFQSRAAARQEQLQAQYDSAKTPEQKAAIVKRIQDLSGKDAGGSWKAIALQGGTDAMGNKTEGVLAAVNEHTGEVKRLDSPQQAQAKRPVGLRSTVKGDTAVWDGTQWIPE
ncbi:hypothetical protein [Aquabacterium sp.]|uniref:hypothetical protein n=1 Tax=Aquabacterium sp. TaxID=1872578 RepID=UPI002489A511|nr:hypothetical protein [Aquabacterium sp.]MDI1260241.1 hypothetical protein [Aquabacterium sp.]